MSFVRRALLTALALMILAACPMEAAARSVLLVSIDGLRADDLTRPGGDPWPRCDIGGRVRPCGVDGGGRG